MEDFIDDPLGLYLREVSLVSHLSPEEEAACVRPIRAGDQEADLARERLVEANLALVVSIAQRYQNDRVHILDLIVEGNNGLLRAVEAFRDGHEETFSAHATAYVERAIARAVAAPGSTFTAMPES